MLVDSARWEMLLRKMNPRKVTDGGGIFYSTQALQLYDMLGIRKERIEAGKPWQNYAETLLYVMWNLKNSLHNLHYVDLTLDSYAILRATSGNST